MAINFKTSFLIPITLMLWLCSCSKTSYELSSDSSIEQLQAIKSNLPTECKTDSILSQINAVEKSIKSTVANCDTEIKNERYRKYLGWLIAGLLLFLLIRRR